MKKIMFQGSERNALQASLWAPEGAGRPRVALLLHGGGQTRHAWDKTGLALSRIGWTAIALDQRGHGDSAWIDSAAYSFADYGRDVVAVAGQIATQFGAKPVAIGASLGGIASLASFALTPAPVLAGLVLVDIIPKMDPKGVAHIQGFMRARAREGFASVEEAADAIAAYLPHRPRPRSLAGLAKNLRLHADGRWRWHWDPRFLWACPSVHRLGKPRAKARGGGACIARAAAARARGRQRACFAEKPSSRLCRMVPMPTSQMPATWLRGIATTPLAKR